MRSFLLVAVVPLAAGILVACGCGGGQGGTRTMPGTGGRASASGGASATGGSGPGSGGAVGTGGRPATGGSGGTASTGGAGGAASTGGAGGTNTTANGCTARNTNFPTKFVGNITTAGQVRTDFKTYWDQITPENEGKWGSVEATRNQMNWAGLDRVHDYAKTNGLVFKQHNMVWGSQQPSWVAGLTAAQQAAEVEEWIKLFCQRYPDVGIIDVVNEPPPHTTPSYLNALGGAGTTGYDWIVWAFRKTRQYCPNAILVLNDYNVLRYGDADNFIKIANAVKGSNCIDALGSQSHDQEDQTMADLQSRLTKLIAVGLPIYITEFDVNTTDDNLQRTVYQNQMTLFWNTPEIKGITIWGYIFGSTWAQAPNSGLIRNGTARPALTWLMDFLGR